MSIDIAHSNNAGLFQRFFEIERDRGRTVKSILDELNQAAGTNYKHNWASVIASRDFKFERCPKLVRQHMMKIVLKHELSQLKIELTDLELERLIFSLT